MKPKADRPVRCRLCRAELVDADEDCLVLMHCTQCGFSFVIHVPHCDCVVVKPNVASVDDWV